MNIPNQQRFKSPLRVRPLARYLLLKISSDSSFTLNNPITQPTVNPIGKFTAYDNITFTDGTLRGRKPQWVLVYSNLNQHPSKTKLKSCLLRFVFQGVPLEAVKKLSDKLRTASRYYVSLPMADTIDGIGDNFIQLFTPVYGVRDSPVKELWYLQNLYMGISWRLIGEYLQFMGDTS